MNGHRLIHALSLTLVVTFLPGATKISTGNGNWTSGGSWSPAGAPGAGDSIIIQSGHSIVISSNLSYSGAEMVIVIRGTFAFDNGKKIKLPCNSRIYIFDEAQITVGGGGSSNLKYAVQRFGNPPWETS